jgi:hypothetical protein
MIQVQRFVEDDCLPADPIYEAQLGEGRERWETKSTVMDDLKGKAKKLGLWNMFMPGQTGANFTNLEYGLMAEYLGKSHVASEVRSSLRLDGKESTADLLVHLGYELLGTRYGQHGGPAQIWNTRAERKMAAAIAGRQDPLGLPHD